MHRCTGDPNKEDVMAGWQPASNVQAKEGDTGTTYKLLHNGQELRVRVRTDRDQIEFWAAGAGWVVTRVQVDKNGAGVHMMPR
jgi:hypothetical protein